MHQETLSVSRVQSQQNLQHETQTSTTKLENAPAKMVGWEDSEVWERLQELWWRGVDIGSGIGTEIYIQKT